MASSVRLRDLLALTKPSVTRMCLVTTAGGLWLAPEPVAPLTAAAALVGVSLIVGGANAFNMWIERETDALMRRTRRRPLPAGRLAPGRALAFAWILSILGTIVLALGTNLLTAALGVLAVVGYAAVYTPLKYRTPAALVIGAVPGAAPPLLGWTAATGQIQAPGLVLFGVLLAWQIPHFIAIALYRREEYAKAGIRTVALVRGAAMAKIHAVAWAMVLVPLSMMLAPLGVAGPYYVTAAFILGAVFLGWSFSGLDRDAGPRWARGFFLASLVYLPLLTLALVLDVTL